MAITPKTPSSVAAPNTLTQESAASVAVPNTLTQESAASVAVPNTLTQESAASVAVPNTLTQETAASVAIPNTLTQEAAASVAVPNTLTQESAATVAVPNTLTQESAAGFPRCLTPKIAFDFADEKYSLCGEPKALSDITTYSRASSATFINRRVDGCTGDYEYFVDTDYVGSVTNLLTYSEQFDNAAWTKTRASITANNIVDPDGNRTAEKLVEDSTASNTHYVEQGTITVTTATDYTFSVYAKAGTRKFIRLRETDGITGGAYFNLESGAIGSIAGTGDPLPAIEHVGDGWYRCSLTFTSSGTSSTPRVLLAESDGGESYTGDGESYVYIWGAQLTESAKPLPYVQTTTASASNTFSESVRIEYDPATGDSLGALIEGASTNLQIRSEDFDNAAWNSGSLTVTANNAISPDGTKSADKAAASTTSSIAPSINDSNTVTASESYTVSVYAKAGEASFLQVFFGSGNVANNPRVNFDLSSGTVGSQDNDIDSATIKSVGNGWFRLSATVTAASTSLQSYFSLVKSSTDTRSQANSWTAGDGLYLWGAQVEELPFPSSYIRTEGSSVSRSADSVSRSESQLYSGTMLIKSRTLGNSNPSASVLADSQSMAYLESSTSNYIGILADSLDSSARVLNVASGVTQTSYTSSNNFSTFKEVALTFTTNNVITYIDDTAENTDTSAIIPVMDTLKIGENTSGAAKLYGHVKEFQLYDKVLTAKEVELL